MKPTKSMGAWMARVGEKGQIVIPKEAREMFGIAPGDTLLLLGDLKQGLAIVTGEKMLEVANGIFSSAPQPQEGQGVQDAQEGASDAGNPDD